MSSFALMTAAESGRLPLNTTAILATAKSGGRTQYHTLQTDSTGSLRCLGGTANTTELFTCRKGEVKMALVTGT